MGFQWFRDLKEMRSISPEKLQKNIFQQTTYVGMYTSDLMNEVRRFDVARLLRYTCVHRNSLGTDSFNALTTDCLLVFLHGMSFSNTVSWKPSDEETAVIGKGVRNLHRLIGEHLKAVTRYIEYSVLLKVANNEIAFDEAEKEREDLFLSLIPKKARIDVSKDELTNLGFDSLIKAENDPHGTFTDHDVLAMANLDPFVCNSLSKVPGKENIVVDSPYGIIGCLKSFLTTPFVKYNGRYYCFVTSFCLPQIAEAIGDINPQNQVEKPFEDVIPPVEKPLEDSEEEPEEEVIDFSSDEGPSFEMPTPFVSPVVKEPEKELVEETVEEASTPVEDELIEEVVAPEEISDEQESFVEPTVEESITPTEEWVSEEVLEESIEEPEESFTESSEKLEEDFVEPVDSEEGPVEEPIEEIVEEIFDEKTEEPIEEVKESEDVLDNSDIEEIFEEDEDYYDEDRLDAVYYGKSESNEEEASSYYEDTEEYESSDELKEFEEDEEETDNSSEAYYISEEEEDSTEVAPVTNAEIRDDYISLVSPDAYEYLNETEEKDFVSDELLEEQEALSEAFDSDEGDSVEEEVEEPDPYSNGGLFDSLLEEVEDYEEEEHLAVYDEVMEEKIQPPLENNDIKSSEEEYEALDPGDEVETEVQVESQEIEEQEVLNEEPSQEEQPKEDEPIEEEEPAVPEPQNEMLPILEHILKYCPSRSNPIALYFERATIQQQKDLAKTIEQGRKAFLSDGKDKIFTIPDTNISVALFSVSKDPMMRIQRSENIGAIMYSFGKEVWNSLELYFDGEGKLMDAKFGRVDRSCFSDWEWKIVMKLGQQIFLRRGSK